VAKPKKARLPATKRTKGAPKGQHHDKATWEELQIPPTSSNAHVQCPRSTGCGCWSDGQFDPLCPCKCHEGYRILHRMPLITQQRSGSG